jgi:hypothetical protein
VAPVGRGHPPLLERIDREVMNGGADAARQQAALKIARTTVEVADGFAAQ